MVRCSIRARHNKGRYGLCAATAPGELCLALPIESEME